MTNHNNIQKGQAALLIILVVLVVILIIGTGVASLTSKELRMSTDVKNSAMAIQMADTGIEQALYIHNTGGGLNTTITGNWSSGNLSYSWSVKEGDPGFLIIKSIGRKENIKRTIEAIVPTFSSTVKMLFFHDGKKVDGNWLDDIWPGPGGGWSILSGCEPLSEGPGAFLENKFIMGDAIFSSFIGSGDHSHNFNSGSMLTSSSASDIIEARATGVTGPRYPACRIHQHWNITSSSSSNDPFYRYLKVVEYINGIPDEIPEGAIVMFQSLPLPSGFEYYSNQEGFFIKGGSNITGGKNFVSGEAIGEGETGEDGGAESHNHNFTGEIGNMLPCFNPNETCQGSDATIMARHTHEISGCETDYAVNNPPAITVILGKAIEDMPIPDGLIGMFTGNPDDTGEYWTVLSNSGGPFYKRLLKANDSYGNISGSEAHSHNTSCSTGPPISINTLDVRSGAEDYHTPISEHYHYNMSTFDAGSYPDSYGVVIAENLGEGSGVPPPGGFPTEYKEVLLDEKKESSCLAEVSSFFNDFLERFSQRVTEIVKSLEKGVRNFFI